MGQPAWLGRCAGGAGKNSSEGRRGQAGTAGKSAAAQPAIAREGCPAAGGDRRRPASRPCRQAACLAKRRLGLLNMTVDKGRVATDAMRKTPHVVALALLLLRSGSLGMRRHRKRHARLPQ